MDGLPSSIFVGEDAEVHDRSVISRPLPSQTDPAKVQQFIKDMQAGAVFTPIEVAWVQEGQDNYYFAFGGCHRWAAVQALALPTIRARLIRVSPATIDTYLGSSSPFRRKQQAGAAEAAPVLAADKQQNQQEGGQQQQS